MGYGTVVINSAPHIKYFGILNEPHLKWDKHINPLKKYYKYKNKFLTTYYNTEQTYIPFISRKSSYIWNQCIGTTDEIYKESQSQILDSYMR